MKTYILLFTTVSNIVLAQNTDDSLNLIRATIDEETRLRIERD